MNFTNYQDFRAKIGTLIDGDDTGGDFRPETLDLIIGLGERRVVDGDNTTPGLRASSMLTPMTLTVTSNSAPLPADLLQLKEVLITGRSPMDIVPLERVRDLLAASYSNVGLSQYAAQNGDALMFWPAASGTVVGSYYARPTDLSTGLHATFLRYPQLYTYACLYEAALFYGMAGQLQAWEARYRQLADGANHSELTRVYGGGRLRVRRS